MSDALPTCRVDVTGRLSRGVAAMIVAMAQHGGSMVTSSGRVIAWQDGGDPNGYPVIGLHGTPGCRLSRWPDDAVYVEAGTRYVTTDRAGYGLSTRHRGRSVAAEAADVLAVADALGFDRFAVVGGSGGGPHALASAALLAGRVERVACQSSLAPLGARGLTREQWLAGMDSEMAAELSWAEAGEDVLFRELESGQRLMEKRIAEDPGALLGDDAPTGDVAFLRRPEVVDAFRRIIGEQARNGVGGSVDDTLAFVRDWEFDLSTIVVPVLLTYGDADTSCPVKHGRFLAAEIGSATGISGATVVETAGGGHLPGENPTEEILETHRWLRTGAL